MLLHLAYLAVTNTLSLIRLLPMSQREMEIETLALRHQLAILQRQSAKPTFTAEDRFILAGPLHRLPIEKLRRPHLPAQPDTILRWHRNLLKRRHAARCVPRGRGRPRTVRSVRALVLHLARAADGSPPLMKHAPLSGLTAGQGRFRASGLWSALACRAIRPHHVDSETAGASVLDDLGRSPALADCGSPFHTATSRSARSSTAVFAVSYAWRFAVSCGITTTSSAASISRSNS